MKAVYAYVSILLLVGIGAQARKMDQQKFRGRIPNQSANKDMVQVLSQEERNLDNVNGVLVSQIPSSEDVAASFLLPEASTDIESRMGAASSVVSLSVPHHQPNNQVQSPLTNEGTQARSFFDGNVSTSSLTYESNQLGAPIGGGFVPLTSSKRTDDPASFTADNRQLIPALGYDRPSFNTADPNVRGPSPSASSPQTSYVGNQQLSARASNQYEQQYGDSAGSQSGYNQGNGGQGNDGYSSDQGNGEVDGYGSGPSTSILAQQAANQAKAAQAAQNQAAASAAQQAAASLANEASDAAQKAAALVIAKQQQAAQISQAAQAAQSAAAAEAALASQINEAIQSTSGAQSQTNQLTQAVNDLVERSRSQGDTVQRVLQQLQAILSTQNQMAYQAEQKARYLAQREEASLRDLAATQQAAEKAAVAARTAQANVPSSGAPYSNGQNGYGPSGPAQYPDEQASVHPSSNHIY